jgi:hypothetical protein
MKIFVAALVSRLPQLGVGGWMPRPRKLNVVSARMAAPASSVAETMSGASELGKRWRSMTRQREAPRHCAASTNSCSRNDSTALRARRAALVHSKATRMMMMFSKPGPASFDRTSKSTMRGIV